MSARAFIALGAAVAAAALRAEVPASAELHFLLLTDSLLLSPVTASLAPAAAVPAKEIFPLAPPGSLPSDPLARPPLEDPVSEFFRTGILLSDNKDHPVKKLSVGPCEGGQLLNLRTNW